MYMRGVRTTFTNDLMKDAVLNFMSQQLSDERMITFAVHLSDNQLLRVSLYPDESSAANALKQMKPFTDKIKQMDAKHETFEGPVSNFQMNGGLTLDQLLAHTTS